MPSIVVKGMGENSLLLTRGLGGVEVEIEVVEAPTKPFKVGGNKKRKDELEYLLKCKITYINDEECENNVQNEIIVPIDKHSIKSVKVLDVFYEEANKLVPIADKEEFKENPIKVFVNSFIKIFRDPDEEMKVEAKIKKDDDE